ncbi:hypothetical protein D3C79_632570 [compost metagenome]
MPTESAPRRSTSARQLLAHPHQGIAEQVKPLPLARISGLRRLGIQADAPDPVYRACFDEHTASSGKQEVAQCRVLCKFQAVSLLDNRLALSVPDLLVKATDATAQGLGLERGIGAEDLRE